MDCYDGVLFIVITAEETEDFHGIQSLFEVNAAGLYFLKEVRVLFLPVEFRGSEKVFLCLRKGCPVAEAFTQTFNLFKNFGSFFGRQFPEFVFRRFTFQFFQAVAFVFNFKDTLLSWLNAGKGFQSC